jgi:hypothetical protein
MQVQPVMPKTPYGEPRSDLSDILTPEQNNTVQQGADDKIAEQVENVKSTYQTAKDIDLMQSYYQQQQKLFDIYLQTSIGSNSENSSTLNNQNVSAVSSLTDAYADLYQLHQHVKDGVATLPEVELPSEDINILPMVQLNQVTKNSSNSTIQASSLKQMDTYNSLMMPSTASYVHLSA